MTEKNLKCRKKYWKYRFIGCSKFLTHIKLILPCFRTRKLAFFQWWANKRANFTFRSSLLSGQPYKTFRKKNTAFLWFYVRGKGRETSINILMHFVGASAINFFFFSKIIWDNKTHSRQDLYSYVRLTSRRKNNFDN